jgi:hypothetical protein
VPYTTNLADNEPGVDFRGIEATLILFAGDTLKLDTTLTLPSGVTISSTTLAVYDEDGDAVSGLTCSATISGSTITWGLYTSAETALLGAEEYYSYRLRCVLSNGMAQTLYYGPLKVDPASGRTQ